MAIGAYCLFLVYKLFRGEETSSVVLFLGVNGALNLCVDGFVPGPLSLGAAVYLYTRS